MNCGNSKKSPVLNSTHSFLCAEYEVDFLYERILETQERDTKCHLRISI